MRTAEWIARLLKSALEHELKLRETIRNGSNKDPVVIEPETPEERRDLLMGSDEKRKRIDILEDIIGENIGVIDWRGWESEHEAFEAEQKRALWVRNITNTRDGSNNGP